MTSITIINELNETVLQFMLQCWQFNEWGCMRLINEWGYLHFNEWGCMHILNEWVANVFQNLTWCFGTSTYTKYTIATFIFLTIFFLWKIIKVLY